MNLFSYTLFKKSAKEILKVLHSHGTKLNIAPLEVLLNIFINSLFTYIIVFKGEDYDRIKLLHIEASEAERLDRKKKKKNPDIGFADYEQATIRQYNRLTKTLKPDMEIYNRQKEKLGEGFYGGRNTIIHGLHKDTTEGIEKMVTDLEKQ